MRKEFSRSHKGAENMYEEGITVITAIYNCDKYLNKMLESVFTQTYKNFNIILVNDGSSDNSEQIVLKYLDKYPNNIIYLKQENRGVSEARNIAIPQINKKYTLFLDADDFINKYMFETMYEKAESSKSDIIICGYNIIYDYCNKEKKILFDLDEKCIYKNSEILEKMLKNEIEGQLWNKMFLSRNLIESSIIFEKGRIIEDLFPVFNQVFKAKRIAYIDKELYTYRKRHTSLLHVSKDIDIMKDQVYAYKKIAELIKDKGIISKKIYFNFISLVEGSTIEKCVKMNLKCSKEVYEQYKVDDFCVKDIVKSKALLKDKIKLLLYKMNLLHIYYCFTNAIKQFNRLEEV